MQYFLRADTCENIAILLAELTRVTEARATGDSASMTVLAIRLNKSRRTIQRNLNWLVAHGLVKREVVRPDGERQRANIYQLTHDVCRHAARVDVIVRRRMAIRTARDRYN